MTPLRIGSLCTGYGGLDMAVQAVLPGAEIAWHAQYEPPDKDGRPDRHQWAAQILAHRYPGVPNHGDITAIDFAAVEPVDVLTAGFPCTDISLAGKQAGLRAGTRSGIWAHVARAVAVLRPSLVAIENVRSLTSADADSDMEPCTWCLGDDGDESVLRALGAVLGDLADQRFDAEWTCLRASDVGAPHQRHRIFILARPADADADDFGPHRGRPRRAGRHEPAAHGQPAADAGRDARAQGDPDGPAAARRGREDVLNAPSLGRRPQGQQHGLGTAQRSQDAADTDGSGRSGWTAEAPEAANELGPGSRTAATRPGAHAPADADCDALRQQPVAEPRGRGPAEPGVPGGQRDVAADADGAASRQDRDSEPSCKEADHERHRMDASGRFLGWGPYGPAVARWEHVLGRSAPSPVDERGRLAPVFVEWMMGLPAGWVTDVPGIPRNAQLKALGNGVVPQQGAAAFRILAERLATAPERKRTAA